jgi:hypothetical protein
VGDAIWGYQWIVQGDVKNDGDYWSILTVDATAYPEIECQLTMSTGAYGGTGGSDPAFDTVYAGVLEVQGLAACDGLPGPGSGGEVFNIVEVDQEGTGGWNTYVDVTTSLGWAWGNPPAYGPSCGWDAYYDDDPTPAALLFWN